MQRLDQDEGPQWFAAAVYGRSGSGKTSLGVTAPKPLILLSERQGLLHVKQAAKRRGVPVPPVLFLEHLEDCRAVLRALRGPKDQPLRIFEVLGRGPDAQRNLLMELEWPETVVLDSLTDILRLVVEEIREQSPPRQGKDGLPVDSERYWNVLGDRCQNLILGFRDAPVNKLFLCAEDDRFEGEGDDRRRQMGPSLPMRKLPAVLSGAVNLTAYAYRREVRENQSVKVSYGVMTSGPEYMLLKPCAPLRVAEVPDFTYWVRAVRGLLEGPAPAAPAPSGESMAAPVSEADQPVKAEPAAAAAPQEAPAAAQDAAQAEPAATGDPEAPEAPADPPAAVTGGRKRSGGKGTK